MKVSGFTFVRNGNSLDYPFVPAICSLLPLCDEIIVNVPRSTDDTLAAVKAIGSPKSNHRNGVGRQRSNRWTGAVSPHQSGS